MSNTLIEISSPKGLPYNQLTPVGDIIAAHSKDINIYTHELEPGLRQDVTPMLMVRPDYLYVLEVLTKKSIYFIVQNRRCEILPSDSAQLKIDVPRVIVGDSEKMPFLLFTCVILTSGENDKLNLLLTLKDKKLI